MYGRNKKFLQMLLYLFIKDNVKIYNIDIGFKTAEILTLGTYLGFWMLNGNHKYIFRVIEMFI